MTWWRLVGSGIWFYRGLILHPLSLLRVSLSKLCRIRCICYSCAVMQCQHMFLMWSVRNTKVCLAKLHKYNSRPIAFSLVVAMGCGQIKKHHVLTGLTYSLHHTCTTATLHVAGIHLEYSLLASANQPHTNFILTHVLYRYNEAAHTVEFLLDGSNQTYWQSAANESPVSVQVNLASLTNLSKIFIHFESALPTFAMLEYMQNSQWEPLQYWAENCTNENLNERFVSIHQNLIALMRSYLKYLWW